MKNIIAYSMEKLYKDLEEADELFLSSGMKDMELYEKQLAAAGCMVCVTAQEMIPQAVEGDEPAGVVSIVLGFALMMALDVAL